MRAIMIEKMKRAIGREPTFGNDCVRPVAVDRFSPKQTSAILLNYLVSADQKGLRDGKAERFGGLAVDH